MKILSIIPVNDLDRTKSRLSSILHVDERRSLTLQLLDRTIRTLRSCAGIDEILVLTPDPRVLSFAQERGVLGLKEEKKGLNTGLEQATRWALDHGDEALLLLPCDLAFLEKGDVETLITMGEAKEKIMVIAPNQGKNGTNALFVKPPGIVTYAFGDSSYDRHRSQALSRRTPLKVYSSQTIMFDLDSPAQYHSWFKVEKKTP